MEGSCKRQSKWGGLTFFSLFLLLVLSVFFGMTGKGGGLRLIGCQSLISSLYLIFLLRFVACHVLAQCSPYLFILKPLIFIFFLPLVALMLFLAPILIYFCFVHSLTSPTPVYTSHGSLAFSIYFVCFWIFWIWNLYFERGIEII